VETHTKIGHFPGGERALGGLLGPQLGTRKETRLGRGQEDWLHRLSPGSGLRHHGSQAQESHRFRKLELERPKYSSFQRAENAETEKKSFVWYFLRRRLSA
jgi:hypothetical protein